MNKIFLSVLLLGIMFIIIGVYIIITFDWLFEHAPIVFLTTIIVIVTVFIFGSFLICISKYQKLTTSTMGCDSL